MASPQTLARHYARQHSRTPASVSTRTGKVDSTFAWMKHGIGKLTATVDAGKSRLTRVSHKAPMRWLPLQNCSRVDKAGAAVAAMSNYGAGLLPGDVQEIHLQVNPHARLGVLTQGSNRIYKQRKTGVTAPAKSTLQARVEEGGFLVVAPDPTACFATSSFVQQQQLLVHPTSSAIVLDWFSSGRFANGERWQAAKCSSQTQLTIMGQEEAPLVWDATTLDQRVFYQQDSRHYEQNPFGFDLGNQSFNAYASMILYGEQTMPVVEQLQSLQHELAAKYTRLRRQAGVEDTLTEDKAKPHHDLGTTGRVILGVNQLDVTSQNDTPLGPVYLARWVASSNEDLYRTLHHCLKPLAPLFGLEFYKERIRAASSGAVFHHHQNGHTTQGPSPSEPQKVFSSAKVPDVTTQTSTFTSRFNSSTDPKASWNAYMLADSALPTGSFAHSSGLEAASQLGLLESNASKTISTTNDDVNLQDNAADETSDNVELFIQASTRSTLQQCAPWVMAGHDLIKRYLDQKEPTSLNDSLQEWTRLDRHAHSVMVCSSPACRASLDQGRNSLRVALPWFRQSSPRAFQLLQAIQDQIEKYNSTSSGHLGPLFGILGGALDLQGEETCQLLGYCVARDVVSSAVRLNLIGPLASVGILSKAQSAAHEGIQISLESGADGTVEGVGDNWLLGSCSPIIEAVHPSHDLLAVRLFRT